MESNNTTIAVLGGTGALGSGLARRWARAGYTVLIGTRDPARAAPLVAELQTASEAAAGSGSASYQDAAAQADLAVLTVPFDNQIPILERVRDALADKILIDCTVPLRPPKVGTVQLPQEGSAAQRAQALLGADTRVVSAFQNVSAVLVNGDRDTIDCDILVSGDDAAACTVAVGLAKAAGMNALHVGPLANAAAAEALTSILIQINKRYKSKHAGIRITGLDH